MTKRATARSPRRASAAGIRAGLASAGRAGARVGGVAGVALQRICYWAPVWLPAIVLMHFTVLGLSPARAEGQRLDDAEAAVESRAATLQRERADLLDDRRCLEDEVYRERVRRTLRNANCEPLRLVDARRAIRGQG